MLQLEDRLSANVNPSGHISILLEPKVSCVLLAHLVHYFLQCWLFCREVWGQKCFCLFCLFPHVKNGFSQTSAVRNHRGYHFGLMFKVRGSADCGFWFSVLFLILSVATRARVLITHWDSVTAAHKRSITVSLLIYIIILFCPPLM